MADERDSERREMSATLTGETPVAAAVTLARSFADAHQISPDDRARLCIVVEELAANLSDHGRRGREAPVLRLKFEVNLVRLTLTDTTQPFDLRNPSVLPGERSRGGGAGLALVRAWTEILDYLSADGRNRLELILRLDGARRSGTRSTPGDQAEGTT